MKYRRMPVEFETPEPFGYGNLRCSPRIKPDSRVGYGWPVAPGLLQGMQNLTLALQAAHGGSAWQS